MKRKNKTCMGKMNGKAFRLPKAAAWLAGIGLLALVLLLSVFFLKNSRLTKPRELLQEYMSHIPRQEYEEMYDMICKEESGNISKEDYIQRNSAIYEGMEIKNMKIAIKGYDKRRKAVAYRMSFDTAAGKVGFENEAYFVKGKKGYELIWQDSLIFPGLLSTDKIKVSVTQAKRGEILDRNDRVLAGEGTAYQVGIVPGKLVNRDKAAKAVAKLLEMEPETILKKLDAKWVKEDSFVPIRIIPKTGRQIPLEGKEEKNEKLLEIPGIMLSDVTVRNYPYGEAAAHLVGYVQNVTAEDLKEHEGEGYTDSSVIGRSGVESLFEKALKGKNGCRIYIEDKEGKEKKEIARTMTEDGEDVRLTIDAKLQACLYEQFREDKSCHVAMNPENGEVLALVSTPSFDSNSFIMGMSSREWKALNEDEQNPLYNRFRQVWCPGSSFKPVTCAIGLETGAIHPEKEYKNEGLSWQKDSSWGSYYVTTLHEYEPVTMENALIYSDNIYFAKAALSIGKDELTKGLQGLGFQKELPFPIKMAKSQYSNTGKIETEIQLADSGYGQGQILVNPLHLAGLYSAFLNEGTIKKPVLLSGQGEEDWISQAFSEDTANTILEALKKVVNEKEGTGYSAHRNDEVLAGKTGTAEIKESKEDASGTELGWFAVFTAEKNVARPILLVSMTEDVKDRGGSGYVVRKDAEVLEQWFTQIP